VRDSIASRGWCDWPARLRLWPAIRPLRRPRGMPGGYPQAGGRDRGIHSRCRRRPGHGIVQADDGLRWLDERASIGPRVAEAMPTPGLRRGRYRPWVVRVDNRAWAVNGLSDAFHRPRSGY
jgi:hypothetical protein